MTPSRPTASEPRPLTSSAALVPSGTLPEAGLIAFAAALAEHPLIRIDHAPLWAMFARAFPRHPTGAAQRAWFVTALEDAAARGVIVLPPRHGRLWDRAAEPMVPTQVTKTRPEPRSVPDEWRSWVWHPSLAWVPQLTLMSTEELKFLRRVHDGLLVGAFEQWAPFKHRSLALAGDEKRLANFVTGRLFMPGRLTLSVIGTEQEIPPLAWMVIRSVARPRILVFENSGPSDLAIRLLREIPHPAWDVVAYGAGKAFGSAIVRLTSLQPETISYVGDLDPDGVAIARAADRNARTCGLPAVVPAAGFHEAMLADARRLGAPDGWLPDAARAARIRRLAGTGTGEWLPSEVLADFARIAALGHRIPEEVFDPMTLKPLLATRDR